MQRSAAGGPPTSGHHGRLLCQPSQTTLSPPDVWGPQRSERGTCPRDPGAVGQRGRREGRLGPTAGGLTRAASGALGRARWRAWAGSPGPQLRDREGLAGDVLLGASKRTWGRRVWEQTAASAHSPPADRGSVHEGGLQREGASGPLRPGPPRRWQWQCWEGAGVRGGQVRAAARGAAAKATAAGPRRGDGSCQDPCAPSRGPCCPGGSGTTRAGLAPPGPG